MSTELEEAQERQPIYVSEHVRTATVCLQAAVRGLTAYPPGHTIPASLIDRAHEAIRQAAVERDGTLDLEVVESLLRGNGSRFRDHLRAPHRLVHLLKERALRALIFRADVQMDGILAAAAVLACDTDVLYEHGGAALVLLEAAQYGVIAVPVIRQVDGEADPGEQRWNALTVDVAKGLITSDMGSDEAKSLVDTAQSPAVADVLEEAARRACDDETSAERLTQLLLGLARAVADPNTDADAAVELVQQFLAESGSPADEQVAALLQDPAILAVLSSIGLQAASKLTKVLEALSQSDNEDDASARAGASLLVGNQAALLRRLLEEERDPYEYRTLLDALAEAFPEQIVCGHFDEAHTTVQLLVAHADGAAPEGSAGDAAMTIERLASRYVLELILHTLAERTSAQHARLLHDTVTAMGTAAVPGLAGLLEEAELRRVRDIVRMLGSIGTPEAVEALVDELRSADIARGRAIIEALRHQSVRASTPVLLACLEHKQPALRQAAVFALGQLQDPGAISRLGRVAGRWRPFGLHEAVRREAVRALGGLLDPAAADELANVALGRRFVWLRRDTDVRTAAVRALARHQSPKAREYLGLIARRCKGGVAAEAQRALGDRARPSDALSEATEAQESDIAYVGGDTAVPSAERG